MWAYEITNSSFKSLSQPHKCLLLNSTKREDVVIVVLLSMFTSLQNKNKLFTIILQSGEMHCFDHFVTSQTLNPLFH